MTLVLPLQRDASWIDILILFCSRYRLRIDYHYPRSTRIIWNNRVFDHIPQPNSGALLPANSCRFPKLDRRVKLTSVLQNDLTKVHG